MGVLQDSHKSRITCVGSQHCSEHCLFRTSVLNRCSEQTVFGKGLRDSVRNRCSEQMFGTDSVRNNVPSQHSYCALSFLLTKTLTSLSRGSRGPGGGGGSPGGKLGVLLP